MGLLFFIFWVGWGRRQKKAKLIVFVQKSYDAEQLRDWMGRKAELYFIFDGRSKTAAYHTWYCNGHSLLQADKHLPRKPQYINIKMRQGQKLGNTRQCLRIGRGVSAVCSVCNHPSTFDLTFRVFRLFIINFPREVEI